MKPKENVCFLQFLLENIVLKSSSCYQRVWVFFSITAENFSCFEYKSRCKCFSMNKLEEEREYQVRAASADCYRDLPVMSVWVWFLWLWNAVLFPDHYISEPNINQMSVDVRQKHCAATEMGRRHLHWKSVLENGFGRLGTARKNPECVLLRPNPTVYSFFRWLLAIKW